MLLQRVDLKDQCDQCFNKIISNICGTLGIRTLTLRMQI